MSTLALEKGWHLQERAPEKKRARLTIIDPAAIDLLKDAPSVMAPKQAGKYIGFSHVAVSEWCRNGIIRARKIRGEWRISKEALAEFISNEDARR